MPIAPVTTRHAAGMVVDSELRIPAGALVLGGSTALAALPVRAGTLLGTPACSSRVSSRYAIQGRDGVEVGDGTRLEEVAMPVLRIDAERTAARCPRAPRPRRRCRAGRRPCTRRMREAATLTQRAGASLSLRPAR